MAKSVYKQMLASIAIVLSVLSAGLATCDTNCNSEQGTGTLWLNKDSINITCGVLETEDSKNYSDGKCTIGCHVEWQLLSSQQPCSGEPPSGGPPSGGPPSGGPPSGGPPSGGPPSGGPPSGGPPSGGPPSGRPHSGQHPLGGPLSKTSEFLNITLTGGCFNVVPSTTTKTVTQNSVTSCYSEPASTKQTIQHSPAFTISTVIPSHTQEASTIVHHTCKGSTSVTPLGVLLGVTIAIMVVIIIGWVYTCWKARSNGKAKPLFRLRSSKTLNTTQDDEERLFENPTYDGTTSTEEQQGTQTEQQQSFHGVTYAIYDTVTTPSQRETESGETYNVLQRGKDNGAVGRTGARRVVSSNNDMSYSLLGLPDKDVKHNYHVIKQH